MVLSSPVSILVAPHLERAAPLKPTLAKRTNCIWIQRHKQLDESSIGEDFCPSIAVALHAKNALLALSSMKQAAIIAAKLMGKRFNR